jgi:transposase
VEFTPTDTQAFMADKSYDCNWLIGAIEQENMIAVIPSKSNRITPRQCDFCAYKERHLIECFFGKIKHYRRIFARYEKKAKNYMGFVRLVSSYLAALKCQQNLVTK